MTDLKAGTDLKTHDRESLPLDRAAVIQIAGDFLDEQGVDQFKLSAIADRAGVTQPALYRHVESAADLWRGLGLATRAELAAELMEASLGRSGQDAVRAVAHAWRTHALNHPGRYRSTERFPVKGDAEMEAAVQRVVDVLTAALRGFSMSEEATAHGALMLRSTLHGFVSFELGDGNPGPEDPDATFEHVIDMLCATFEK